MRFAAVIGVIVVTILPSIASSQTYDRDDALASSRDAIGKQLSNHTLRDTNGQPFRLHALRGKPLIVSMIYTSCHHVCPIITKSLESTVAIAREALGEESFTVATVGFDWQIDTPEQMRVYQASRNIDYSEWHFLSGDQYSVEALAEEVGFQYFASAKGFDHLSQTTIIDAEGRIYRQVYGQDFDAPSIVEPLKELVFDTPREAGLIEHWVDTFRFFCTVYDPNTGRYQFDYSIFLTIFIGVLCLGAVLTFVVKEWRHAR